MNIVSVLFKGLVSGLLAFCGTAWAQSEIPSPKLPTLSLKVDGQVIRVEVARREVDRRQGLMYRTTLGKNEGMLFVYAKPMRLCMWMKNTPLPLSVAFIDAQGKIVNIADMQPHTLQAHCAARPVPYALEMRQGWFCQKAISAGSVVTGLEAGR